MKTISKLFLLSVGSLLLTGCVEDELYTTGYSTTTRTTYTTGSARAPQPARNSYVTGTYNGGRSAAGPVYAPPSRGYSTGSAVPPPAPPQGSYVTGTYSSEPPAPPQQPTPAMSTGYQTGSSEAPGADESSSGSYVSGGYSTGTGSE